MPYVPVAHDVHTSDVDAAAWAPNLPATHAVHTSAVVAVAKLP